MASLAFGGGDRHREVGVQLEPRESSSCTVALRGGVGWGNLEKGSDDG